MKKLVKLEKLLEAGFDRLRAKGAAPEVGEMLPGILDRVTDHVRRSGGRATFPFRRIEIVLRLPDDQRGAARRAFRDVEQRVRHQLELEGCDVPPDLEVRLGFKAVKRGAARPPGPAGEPSFEVRCAGRPSRSPRREPEPAAVRIHVLRGEAGRKRHELRLRRINIGRLESVASTNGRELRRNHVWFVETENTVSRAHAYIQHSGGEFFVFDEGGEGGIRVVRGGERIDVLPRSSLGVRLEHGDRLEIGRRCLIEFTVTAAAKGGGSVEPSRSGPAR
jgi:hypothetical protein